MAEQYLISRTPDLDDSDVMDRSEILVRLFEGRLTPTDLCRPVDDASAKWRPLCEAFDCGDSLAPLRARVDRLERELERRLRRRTGILVVTGLLLLTLTSLGDNLPWRRSRTLEAGKVIADEFTVRSSSEVMTAAATLHRDGRRGARLVFFFDDWDAAHEHLKAMERQAEEDPAKFGPDLVQAKNRVGRLGQVRASFPPD